MSALRPTALRLLRPSISHGRPLVPSAAFASHKGKSHSVTATPNLRGSPNAAKKAATPRPTPPKKAASTPTPREAATIPPIKAKPFTKTKTSPRPTTDSLTQGLASATLNDLPDIDPTPSSPSSSSANDPPPPSSPPKPLKKKAGASTAEKDKRNRIVYAGLAGISLLFSLTTYSFLTRPIEADEDYLEHLSAEEKADPATLARARIAATYRYFTEPAWEKLLPDPLPEPYQRKHTLVLNLDETLVYSSWDVNHGWRTAKRPGVDEFLAYMSRYYELVLFTSQPSFNAQPLVEKLDPLRYFTYYLFKEATRYIDGHPVKDLSHLNRDLSKVIIMDANPTAYSLQPDNAIAVPPWKGDPTDRYLPSIIPFLETIVINDIDDVRPICVHYRGKDIPAAFAQWESDQEEEARIQWEAKRHGKRNLSSLFGGSSRNSAADRPPLPLYQQRREEMRAAFATEHAEMTKEAMEQVKVQQEEQEQALKDMNLTVWDLITKGPPPPPTS